MRQSQIQGWDKNKWHEILEGEIGTKESINIHSGRMGKSWLAGLFRENQTKSWQDNNCRIIPWKTDICSDFSFEGTVFMGQSEVSNVDRQSKCLKPHLNKSEHLLLFDQLATCHWKDPKVEEATLWEYGLRGGYNNSFRLSEQSISRSF